MMVLAKWTPEKDVVGGMGIAGGGDREPGELGQYTVTANQHLIFQESDVLYGLRLATAGNCVREV